MYTSLRLLIPNNYLLQSGWRGEVNIRLNGQRKSRGRKKKRKVFHNTVKQNVVEQTLLSKEEKRKKASITTAKWEEIEAGGFVFQKLMLKTKSNKYIRWESRTMFNYGYCDLLSNCAFIVLLTSCFLFVFCDGS